MDSKIKFKIAGKRWKLRILHEDQYIKKHGPGSYAMTIMHRRRIDINSPTGLDRETLIHELVHAYMSEFCTSSSKIKAIELEEIFCELMAKRGEEILTLADDLLIEAKLPEAK